VWTVTQGEVPCSVCNDVQQTVDSYGGNCKASIWSVPEVPKLWSAPPGGTVGLLVGTPFICTRDLFILNKYDRRI
jgi:hypothetical protein